MTLPNRFELLRARPHMTLKEAQKHKRAYRAKHLPRPLALQELYALLRQYKLKRALGASLDQGRKAAPADLCARAVTELDFYVKQFAQLRKALTPRKAPVARKRET
jgi:hypothetical protein